MSKVTIQGNASGTGTFTIAAPNSDTDRTFSLPDEAGTIVTSAGLPSGIVTASDLPSGAVLQVQSATGPSSTVNGTTAAVNVVSVNITPISSSSKIMIFGTAYASGTGGSNTWLGILLYRGATQLISGPYFGISSAYAGAPLAVNYLDSPATTSQLTYHTAIQYGSSGTSGWSAAVNRSSVTVMEIAG